MSDQVRAGPGRAGGQMGWGWGATMTRMAEVGGDAGGGAEGDLGGAGSGQAGWRHGRGA